MGRGLLPGTHLGWLINVFALSQQPLDLCAATPSTTRSQRERERERERERGKDKGEGGSGTMKRFISARD